MHDPNAVPASVDNDVAGLQIIETRSAVIAHAPVFWYDRSHRSAFCRNADQVCMGDGNGDREQHRCNRTSENAIACGTEFTAVQIITLFFIRATIGPPSRPLERGMIGSSIKVSWVPRRRAPAFSFPEQPRDRHDEQYDDEDSDSPAEPHHGMHAVRGGRASQRGVPRARRRRKWAPAAGQRTAERRLM